MTFHHHSPLSAAYKTVQTKVLYAVDEGLQGLHLVIKYIALILLATYVWAQEQFACSFLLYKCIMPHVLIAAVAFLLYVYN